MNKSLYQINQDYVSILSELDDMDGELTPELEQRLTISEKELQTKASCYGVVIHDYDSKINAIDAQIKRLTELKKSYNGKVEVLKSNISNAMQLFGVDKIESDLVKLSFRKSESVEIVDEKMIPKDYIVGKMTYTVSKQAINEAIKSGKVVSGAELKTNYNLQLK